MSRNIPYIIIGVLLVVIFLLWKNGCNKPPKEVPYEIVRIDTLYDTTYIHDTIVGAPEWVYHHYDTTIWVLQPENVPASTYDSLLVQYIALGNQLYSTNGYETKFPIDTFGFVTVFDTVWSNSLIKSTLVSDLKIPERTITIEKLRPATRQLYWGIGALSNGSQVISGFKAGLMYRDRKDRILELSGGMFGNSPIVGATFYKKF